MPEMDWTMLVGVAKPSRAETYSPHWYFLDGDDGRGRYTLDTLMDWLDARAGQHVQVLLMTPGPDENMLYPKVVESMERAAADLKKDIVYDRCDRKWYWHARHAPEKWHGPFNTRAATLLDIVSPHIGNRGETE